MEAPLPSELIAPFVPCIPAQDQERRTPLHAAAYLGDVAILELLILSGKGQGSGHLSQALGAPLGPLSDPLCASGCRAIGFARHPSNRVLLIKPVGLRPGKD